MQGEQGFNGFKVTLYYYSLWGIVVALVSLAMSMIATCFEGWYRPAYILTEIAWSVNLTIMFVFWLLLFPGFLVYLDPEVQKNMTE